jgi:hypothetical protein
VSLWLFIPPFDFHLSLSHLQDLIESELAEMPSCNLAESVHNKWNQHSGNQGSDLYIATIDDFIRALMQVVRYYQYLKGKRAPVLGKRNCSFALPNAQPNELGTPKS